MADIFSLSGHTPPPPPQPSTPIARPSFLDAALGRGSYMKEFSRGRSRIIKDARQEKHRMRKEMRRQREKIEYKIDHSDPKVYQQFNIRQSQRADKAGLTDRERARAQEKTWLKINKELREQEREAERTIEKRRDEQIKTMRDQLRDGVYNTAA